MHLVGSPDDCPSPVGSVKDAPLLTGTLPTRLVALFSGLVAIAIAIVFMLESELGLPPWDVFHMGISEHTPLSLGTASIVVGLAILVVAWIAGAPPGFGTFANAIVIGLTIDLLVRLPAVDALSAASLPVRMLMVVLGAIEIAVLIAGLLLGGVAGIGTIALALLVGPSLELAFWLLMRLGMASPGPRHAPEFGPLDVG